MTTAAVMNNSVSTNLYNSSTELTGEIPSRVVLYLISGKSLSYSNVDMIRDVDDVSPRDRMIRKIISDKYSNHSSASFQCTYVIKEDRSMHILSSKDIVLIEVIQPSSTVINNIQLSLN